MAVEHSGGPEDAGPGRLSVQGHASAKVIVSKTDGTRLIVARRPAVLRS